ncbi:MAG: type II toxin-antitoxin system VapC family toxin [Planctomycetia bacterium]|nr:type II toxin-antitoxin system VapC family toxin [Planctomycetia bacterium]
MFLLDTNALSDLLKDHAKILARLRAVPQDRPVVTSIISRIEILEGRFASIKKAANREELLIAMERLTRDEERLDTLDILQVSEAVADQFEVLRTNKKLKKIGRSDLLIACIALAHGATLVTRNTKDFTGIPGLTLENWAD